jgi:hypothetical protein
LGQKIEFNKLEIPPEMEITRVTDTTVSYTQSSCEILHTSLGRRSQEETEGSIAPLLRNGKYEGEDKEES